MVVHGNAEIPKLVAQMASGTMAEKEKASG